MPRHKHIWMSTLAVVLAFVCTASMAQAQDKPDPVAQDKPDPVGQDKPDPVVQDKPDPVGTWKWERTRNNRTSESILKLVAKEDKLTGVYKSSRGGEREVKDVKLKGDILSFSYTVEFQDRKFTIGYQGKISGDTIKGTSTFNSGGETRESEWIAKRFFDIASVLGTWNLSVETTNAKRESTVVFSKEGDGLQGTYSSSRGEMALKDIKFEKGELSFQASRERGDRNFQLSYKGKPSGNSIKGTVSVSFDEQGQGRQYSFVGTRKE